VNDTSARALGTETQDGERVENRAFARERSETVR